MRGVSSLRFLVGSALLFAAAFALRAAIDRRSPEPAVVGVLYLVDSTLDGDNVAPNSSDCDDGTGHCTLRAAIEQANVNVGSNGIVFRLPTTDPNYNGLFWTINLTKPLPNVADSVEITGPGADKLVVRRSSGGNYRIFNVTNGATVNLSGMTIRDGNAPSGNGGGVANVNGTVNISNCTINNNAAFTGGGVYNNGTLTMTNCTLNQNSAISEGGGIFSNSGIVTINNSIFDGDLAEAPAGSGTSAYGGGLYVNAGTVTLSACLLSNNSAIGTEGSGGGGGGGGGFGGGVFVGITGTLNVSNCAFSNNSAAEGGIDAGAQGGGVSNQAGTVSITNSTFSKNGSLTGGGVYNGGTLTVSNCTFSANNASSGGGIFNNSGNTANIKSSIIALNLSSAGPDLNGTFIAQGFNLIGKNDGAATSFPAGVPNANNDIVGTSGSPIDPKLDLNGLQYNGGPTPTIALLPGSPAIDKGTSNASTGVLTTDQRGNGFPRAADYSIIANATGGDGADVGAYEFWQLKITSINRLTNGHIALQGLGVPSHANTVQASPDLSPNSFQSLPATAMADGTGALQYDDGSAVGLTKQFYRLSFP